MTYGVRVGFGEGIPVSRTQDTKVHCAADLCLGVSRSDYAEFQGLEKCVIGELSALSGKVTMDLGCFGSPTLALTPYEKPILSGEDRIAAYYRRWIRVEVDSHCSGTEILVRNRDGYIYESDSEDQSMGLLVLKFVKRVTDLVVIANVAYPGAFDCEGGEATVNGRYGFTIPRLSCTRLNRPSARA